MFAEYRFNYFTTSADRDIEAVEIRSHADLYIHSALAGSLQLGVGRGRLLAEVRESDLPREKWTRG